MLEVERKYKLKYLPDLLDNYEREDIEQAYLNFGSKPEVRIRMINGIDCFLYCKSKKDNANGFQVCEEYEIPLSKDAYTHLMMKIDGRVLRKRRYIIPLAQELKVELDLFEDFFDGVCIAEIEFPNEEIANTFKLPDWIGENISDDERIANGFMAVKAKKISEYKDLIIK